MRCPVCDSVITHNTEVCSRCNAALDPTGLRRAPIDDEVHLESDQEKTDLPNKGSDRMQTGIPPSGKANDPPLAMINHQAPDSRLWGGFIRRACAFAVDWAIILLLGLIMFLMSYVGYKVGLSAHGRSVTMENSSGLYFILTWGSVALAAAYFVIFHSLDGRTIGKWMFGLRVIGAENGDVTSSQAFLRWLALVGFAPVLLGFLWVIWSREKRAWHDIVAQTWVIRQ